MYKHPVSRKRDLREREERESVLLVSSQFGRDVSYSISIPEDTILRVAIERGKLRQHPPAEPHYITRGNGHIV